MIEITEISKENIGAFSDLILPSERAGIVNSDTVSVGVYEDDVPVGAVMARITDEGFAVVTSFMVIKEKRFILLLRIHRLKKWLKLFILKNF